MRCWPMTVAGPGLVKTSTTAKCGKYNSPTRYRAICAQHDLALMMRNFSNMFLRARRALEFSHGLDPWRRPGSDAPRDEAVAYRGPHATTTSDLRCQTARRTVLHPVGSAFAGRYA